MPIEPAIVERIISRYLGQSGVRFIVTFSENGDPMPLNQMNGNGVILKAEDALNLLTVSFGSGWRHNPERKLVFAIERDLRLTRLVDALAPHIDDIRPISAVAQI